MTIVVASAAPDGIVLASDSRTTLRRGPGHRIASDSTRKVVEIWPGTAVATYGLADIAGVTVAGLLEEFVAATADPTNWSPQETGRALAEFFDAQFEPSVREQFRRLGVSPLGFLVASYDRDPWIGRFIEVTVPSGSAGDAVRVLDVDTRRPGFVYRGQSQHIRRLLEGFDTEGFNSQVGRTLLTPPLRDYLAGQAYITNRIINLQDAIDVATFIVRLTIDMERLTDGTFAAPQTSPLCGGPIQMIVVNRAGGRWIASPGLSVRPAGMSEWG